MSTREYRQLVRDNILAYLHSHRHQPNATRIALRIRAHLGVPTRTDPDGPHRVAIDLINDVIHQLYLAGTIAIQWCAEPGGLISFYIAGADYSSSSVNN